MFALIGLLVVYAAVGYGVLKWKKISLIGLPVSKEILDILTWPKFLIHSEKATDPIVIAPVVVAAAPATVPVEAAK